jgi:PAS domain S-box-containing protein
MSQHSQNARDSRPRPGTTTRSARAAPSSPPERHVNEGAFRWRLPADGRIAEDLPSWRAFTGQTVETMREWGWLEAIHPADQPEVRTAWQAALATRSPLGIECRVRHHDRGYRTLSLHFLPHLDRRGQIRYWEGSSVDVTRRKDEELARADRKARAQAMETAELLTRERAARRQIEALNADLLRLQALTDTALSHLELDRMLHELLERLLTAMRADDAVVMLVEPEGRNLVLRAARGLEEIPHGPIKVDVGEGFSGAIFAARSPLIVDDLTNYPVASPLLRRLAKSAVGVPLLLGDELLGVLYIGTAAPRRFTEDDVEVLQRVADRVALAIDRAHLYEAERQARQETEVALARAQASESRFRRLVDSGIIGIVVGDAERVIEANDAALQMFGYSRDEIATGRMPWGEWDGRRDARASSDEAANWQADARARQELLTAGSCTPYERVLARPDGTQVPVLLGAALLRREPLEWVCFVIDISERHGLEGEREEARAEAERQAAQLNLIIESMADGVIVYDAQGRTVRTNTAAHRLLGLDAAPPNYFELPARERLSMFAMRDARSRLLTPDELPSMRALGGETITGRNAVDETIHTLDGRVVEVSASAAPLFDHDGHIVGAVGILRDFTERNRLMREREEARVNQLALQEANRRMQAFLGSAGHELRTPLTALKGNVQLLRRRLQAPARSDLSPHTPDVPAGGDPSDAFEEHGAGRRQEDVLIGTQERLERMEVLTNRLVRLVEDVIEVSRVQVGKLELRLADCDLVEVVREAVHEQRQFRPRRTIQTELSQTPVSVRVDRDRLAQVVANYVSNALKYAPDDKPIEISLTADATRARVAVRDHGPGVPVAEQEHIWEEFYQMAGEGGSTQQHVGLGLGLHICKTIVERHGGQVSLDSVPGEGATFWFTLPLATSTPSGGSEARSPV